MMVAMDLVMVMCFPYQPVGHHFVLGHCHLLHLGLYFQAELKMGCSEHFETRKRNIQQVIQKPVNLEKKH
jgi:hypothetical protein